MLNFNCSSIPFSSLLHFLLPFASPCFNTEMFENTVCNPMNVLQVRISFFLLAFVITLNCVNRLHSCLDVCVHSITSSLFYDGLCCNMHLALCCTVVISGFMFDVRRATIYLSSFISRPPLVPVFNCLQLLQGIKN